MTNQNQDGPIPNPVKDGEVLSEIFSDDELNLFTEAQDEFDYIRSRKKLIDKDPFTIGD